MHPSQNPEEQSRQATQPPTTSPAELAQLASATQAPSSTPPANQPIYKRKLFLPIVLMTWPTIGIIFSIFMYMIMNFIFSSIEPSSAPVTSNGDVAQSLFSDPVQHPVNTMMNILLFTVGAFSVALGPISFVVGLVLLIVRLNQKQA